MFSSKLVSISSIFIVLLCSFLVTYDIFNFPNDPFSGREISILFLGSACFFVLSIKSIYSVKLFGKAEILIISFLLYALILNILKENKTEWSIELLIASCYFSLYLLIKSDTRIQGFVIYYILLASFLFQMIVGYLQYFGILIPSSSEFPIIGGFSNPGPFGCYMALGSILVLMLIKKKRKTYIWLFAPLFILFTFSVFLSNSRTAVFSLIVGVLALAFNKINKRLGRARTLIFSFFLGLFIIVALYFQNSSSADGRVFIWKRSYELFLENPLFGLGTGTFQPEYMERQMLFFSKSSHDTKEAFLADTIQHSFNEWINLFVEYGLFGAILLLSILYNLLKNSSKRKKFLETLPLLLTFLIFTLFSYPLIEAPLTLAIVLLFGNLNSIEHQNYTVKRIFLAPILIVLAASIFYYGLNRFYAYQFWSYAKEDSLFGDRRLSISNYQKANNELSNNGFFLYNYASTLLLTDSLQRSLHVFKHSLHDHNNYKAHMNIGNIYSKEKNWQEALKHFDLANNMVPKRFEPLHQMFIIHRDMGNYKAAKKIAQLIKHKKIKVYSSRLTEILKENERFLELH